MRLKQRGFTLIEVLVALALLALVSAGIVPSFLRFVRYNTQMEVKSGALQAAQLVLDNLRFSNPADLPSEGSSPEEVVNINGRNYKVTVSYCTVAAYCSSDNTRHLKAMVYLGSKKLYEVETVYTRLR